MLNIQHKNEGAEKIHWRIFTPVWEMNYFTLEELYFHERLTWIHIIVQQNQLPWTDVERKNYFSILHHTWFLIAPSRTAIFMVTTESLFPLQTQVYPPSTNFIVQKYKINQKSNGKRCTLQHLSAHWKQQQTKLNP